MGFFSDSPHDRATRDKQDKGSWSKERATGSKGESKDEYKDRAALRRIEKYEAKQEAKSWWMK